MLILPPAVHVFLALAPVDLRKSFDALAALVREILLQDPLSGHLFVFRNRRRDRVKLLFWDRTGFWLVYKRLERGAFQFPDPAAGSSLEIDTGALSLLLEGVDFTRVKRPPAFALSGAAPDTS